MTVPRCLALAVAMVCAAPLAGQGYRLRVDSRMQGVSWRGLVADSVPLTAGQLQPGGGVLTPDGHAATCDERYCHYFRTGAVLRGVPWVTQADLTIWGLGLPGLRVRGNARYGTDLGPSARWPGTEPSVQLVEGYLELARERFTVQAGRQFLTGRLGAYGLDGARAVWRQGIDGIEVAAYGGWGLARGTVLPVTSPALNPLDDFQPRDRQLVAGAEVGWRMPGLDARAEYRREVDPVTDYFVSERMAGAVAFRPLRRLSLTAGGIYDLALGEWGSADAAVTWIAPRTTISVGGRRYLPFFDLWTIWGAFSPVAFHAYHGAATLSVVPRVTLRLRGERYVFDDAGASTPLVQVEDRGWRGEGGATWEPTPAWTLSAGYQTEFGPGASSRGFDSRVSWRPAPSLTLGAHAASLRRPLELRFSDASVAIYGADVEWQATPQWRLGLGLSTVQEDRDRPDAGAIDWDQWRFSARVTVLHGSDSDRRRLPPAVRTGATP